MSRALRRAVAMFIGIDDGLNYSVTNDVAAAQMDESDVGNVAQSLLHIT